ncbi:MAG: transporter substrate-binding domain-containing protein, partial [Ruminococcus sp.]|nr:transporter substrate-binding domain-containing protein [Ruminococcus sp.]
GSPFAEIIESKVADVKEYQYFSSIPDMALALKAGKIDAFLTGDVVAETMINQDEKLAAFPVPFGELEVAFALPKDSPDTGNWQAALEKLGEERIQELYEIWTGTDDGKKVLPEQDWPGTNGTVRVASSDSVPPVSYVADNGRLEGLEIAVLLEMAKILDVHLDFSGMDLSSILASLETGKSDIANSCLVVSGERQKILDLVPYHKGTYVLVVRAKEKVVTVPEFTSLSELNGKTFGMQNGSAYGEIIESKVNEIGEYSYYSTIPDMSLALKSGKIDAFLTIDSIADVITAQDSSITIFPEPFDETYMAFTFRKNDPRSAEWQAALEKIGDQRVQELYEIWTGTDESKKVIQEQDWAGSNGTLKVGSCDTVVPLSYVSDDGKLVGLEIALMLEIAREMDVHLEFTGMEFSAVLSALQSGKIDIATPVAVTAERKEMLDMVPYRKSQYLLVVRAVEQTVEQPTFADNLKASFERTFITDSRWKMILLGLGRTVIMAICAGTLGTLLGFGLVLLRHKNNFIINKLIAAYSSLITGIPVVVILMVMYYIVFGKLDAPALIVAIIGFTIIFGARAYGLIHNAVMAVDEGQREAALALGYSEKVAFRRVILPQSKSIYFPTLKTQFVMLVKETSVAGYITVLEMTRAVDLVRSRTMEAFFPLITAAVIYYILTWLLTKIITSAENAFDKKREQRKIKGVD